jgi:hypothetical protein
MTRSGYGALLAKQNGAGILQSAIKKSSPEACSISKPQPESCMTIENSRFTLLSLNRAKNVAVRVGTVYGGIGDKFFMEGLRCNHQGLSYPSPPLVI